jgi:hypothetical protein
MRDQKAVGWQQRSMVAFTIRYDLKYQGDHIGRFHPLRNIHSRAYCCQSNMEKGEGSNNRGCALSLTAFQFPLYQAYIEMKTYFHITSQVVSKMAGTGMYNMDK